MYPKLNPIHYPKAGDKNASFKIGVVPASGGVTQWLQLPGDCRDDYIADMDFHKSGKVVMQQVAYALNQSDVSTIHIMLYS